MGAVQLTNKFLKQTCKIEAIGNAQHDQGEGIGDDDDMVNKVFIGLSPAVYQLCIPR